ATSLLNGPAVTNDLGILGNQSRGRIVTGVAADGVSIVLIRIAGAPPNATFTLVLAQDGQLGNVGSSPGFGSTILVQSDSSGSAFAVYRAPPDFANDTAISRLVDVRVQSPGNPGVTGHVSISILRPPVVLVHGTWSNPSTWLEFTPLNPL